MILFVPLNTNHVLIFNQIIKQLDLSFTVLCHDKIAGDKKYCTELTLLSNNIPYVHFPQKLMRNERENLSKQLKNYFILQKLIHEILESISPKVIVLAVDNDQISNLFLKRAQKKGIKTVIVQEGSARPDARIVINGAEAILKEVLRYCGIHLSYVLHGTSNLFDKYLVSGQSSREVLINRGVPDTKIEITGPPKYDEFMERAGKLRSEGKEGNLLIYAAGFSVIDDEAHLNFLFHLLDAADKLGLALTIKLHPRSSIIPEDVESALAARDLSKCSIIKKGDETIDLLRKAYGLITVASTVVTEALIMDREGIIVNYLANKEKLPFDGYDAVHMINRPEDVFQSLEDSLVRKKPFANKEKLLENNFYKCDGKSGKRAVNVIKSMIST